MNSVLWGIIMVAIGLFLTICGWTESQFWLYRLLVARSRIGWGDRVHQFYRVVGVMVGVFGMLVALDMV